MGKKLFYAQVFNGECKVGSKTKYLYKVNFVLSDGTIVHTEHCKEAYDTKETADEACLNYLSYGTTQLAESGAEMLGCFPDDESAKRAFEEKEVLH